MLFRSVRSGGTLYLNNTDNSQAAYLVSTGTGGNAPLIIATNSTERMRITSGGSVGIGTTSVSSGYKMEVVGDILLSTTSGNRSLVLTTSNANAALNTIAGSGLELASDGTNKNLSFRTGVTTVMYINSSGNVGIGTTSPAVSGLQVSRTGDAYLRVQGGSATYTGFDFLQGTDGVAYVWNRDNKEMLFGTNNTERMRITSGGNVGIGTTSPSTTLHVDASSGGIVRVSRLGTGSGILQMEADGTNGSLSATNAMIFNTNSTERMRITSGGNILVGTTTEIGRAHV